MKSLLNKFAVVVTLALATTVASQAQNASTVEYGRTVVVFDPGFLAGLNGIGATLGGVGFSSVDTTGTIVFPVVNGVVDMQTGMSEIEHLGGISVNANGIALRLQNFIIDTTGAPVITALLVVNNKLVARVPLFDLVYPPNIALPLTTTAGVLQVNGFGMLLDGTAANMINGVFGNKGLAAGEVIGTMNLYAVISPNSAS